jgi:hypothetical protein
MRMQSVFSVVLQILHIIGGKFMNMNIWQYGSGRRKPKYVDKDLPYCNKSSMLRHADSSLFLYNEMASI